MKNDNNIICPSCKIAWIVAPSTVAIECPKCHGYANRDMDADVEDVVPFPYNNKVILSDDYKALRKRGEDRAEAHRNRLINDPEFRGRTAEPKHLNRGHG